MIYRIYHAVFLAVTLLSLSTVQGQEGVDAVTDAGSQELDSKEVSAKAVAVSEVQMGWTTQAVLSSYTGDSHAEGYIDLLIPLLQNDNGMLFLYPRFGLSSDIDPGYSMGLGVRHYLPAIDAIIGGNIFYDRYDSPGGNYYNQLGLGLEVLTRWVDARFNYYIPDSSPNVIDSQKARSRSVDTSSSWGQPYATGYSIRQPYTTTTRTTTVNQLFERFEDTMQGFDAEVGVLTPWLEQYVALRWFAGYYNFNNSYGSDISGLKGRAEIRFSQKLAIDATYYADEEVTGSNWLFGVRMTIPIFMENLTHGRSPFQGSFSGMFDGVNMNGRNRESAILRGGSASSYPSGYALSPFAAMAPAPSYASASKKGSTVRDRMTEQMLRLSGARTSQSDFIENLGKRDVNVDIDTKTRIVVIEDSIVFVDNGRGTAGGPGTFENPLSGIQGGVNRASTLFGNRGDVFVSGTGTTYTEDVTVSTNSVKIWGGGRGFPVNGGRRFTHGSQPVLDGGFSVDGSGGTVSEFLLSGFTIINGFGGNDGVNVADVSSVTIMDNKFSNIGNRGIDIDNTSASGIAQIGIFNNTMSNIGNDAIQIDTDDGVNSVLISITGNRVDRVSDGEFIDLGVDSNGGTVALTISGNQFLNALDDDGIQVDVQVDNGGVANVVISDNVITNTSFEGIDLRFEINNGSRGTALISGNLVSMAGDNGLEIDYGNSDGAVTAVSIVGNQFLNSGGTGIEVDTDWDTSGLATLVIGYNNVVGSMDYGLDLNIDGSTMTVAPRVTIMGNTFLNNDPSSMAFAVDSDLAAVFSGTGNTSSGAVSGFSLEDNGTTGATGSIGLDGATISFPSPGNIAD